MRFITVTRPLGAHSVLSASWLSGVRGLFSTEDLTASTLTRTSTFSPPMIGHDIHENGIPKATTSGKV